MYIIIFYYLRCRYKNITLFWDLNSGVILYTILNICIVALTWLNMVAHRGQAWPESVTRSVSTCLPGGSTSIEDAKAAHVNEEARKATTAVHGARDDPTGAVRLPVNRRSWQAIPAILIWLARARREIWRAAGKKSRGYHRGDRADRNPSVCRSRGPDRRSRHPE